jgi:hypothetical protein
MEYVDIGIYPVLTYGCMISGYGNGGCLVESPPPKAG